MTTERRVYKLRWDAYESRVAQQLVRLGPRLGARVGLPPALIVLLELVVRVSRAFVAESDRPFPERIAEAFSWLENADEFTFDQDSQQAVEDWVRRYQRRSGRTFVEKALGSAVKHRFETAFREDAATVVPALRKGLKQLLPLAHAYDTCVRYAGQQPISPEPLLANIVRLDRLLEALAANDYAAIDTQHWPSVDSTPVEIAALTEEVSTETSDRALRAVEEVGTPLLRKITGAWDVIGVSSDGLSQAAHSMVEFVDRFLRSCVSEEEVLSWLKYHLPARLDELTYLDKGVVRRPTKLGQALCIVHAGGAPDDSLPIFEAVAKAFVTARRRLQALKHADAPTDADASAELEEAIHAIEAAMWLILRFCWLGDRGTSAVPMLDRLRGAS